MRLPSTKPLSPNEPLTGQDSAAAVVTPPVPERYQGVWARTLLETPEGRDTTTWVRWLQTSHWHADLRVPGGLDRSQATGLAQQQGFCGITRIRPALGEQPEICTWHRRCDFQPPRSTPDAGTMVFESPSRVIERGVHGSYLEVWERLPESLGRRMALQRLNASGQPTAERLLLAGDCVMHVRPRSALWPENLQPDETLVEVVQRHPTQAPSLLDFEISFGWLTAGIRGGHWTVERSTLPALEGQAVLCDLLRLDERSARIERGPLAGDWRVLGWTGG
jgi:hypothetical protein